MKFKIFILLAAVSFNVFAKNGGDDAGNGGFAYKQSIKILEMATKELEHKIVSSEMPELKQNPSWRVILQTTLSYDRLQKLYKKNAYRGGRKLAMDYTVNPPSVKVLKPYYEAFMGKTDDELESSSREVQKRLLHEASHIWGYKETQSEDFAARFLDSYEQIETRPTNAMDVVSACSCLNGKADSSNSCEKFCADKPVSSSPLLYIHFAPNAEIALNPKLGNVYNWCTVQLESDATAPQCFLYATDDKEEIASIPVTITPNSNTVVANIQQLSFNKYYKFVLYEGKTGSGARSKAAVVQRKRQTTDDNLGSLKVADLNQYTCLFFGGEGQTRTSYVRQYFHFAGNEIPAPMPPTPVGHSAPVVCHDEQRFPGNDSAEYARLEQIRAGSLYNKLDSRFVMEGSSLKINRILEEKLLADYDISLSLDLFHPVYSRSNPVQSEKNLGYVLTPFENSQGTYCPSRSRGNSPLEMVLKNYIGDTEALYLAEKEAEVLQNGSNYKTLYGTIFITESRLRKVAFTIENGIKKKTENFNNKPVYFYWPASETMDPLVQGGRKLFTIRRPNEVNGFVTEDKKIGCVPLVN